MKQKYYTTVQVLRLMSLIDRFSLLNCTYVCTRRHVAPGRVPVLC